MICEKCGNCIESALDCTEVDIDDFSDDETDDVNSIASFKENNSLHDDFDGSKGTDSEDSDTQANSELLIEADISESSEDLNCSKLISVFNPKTGWVTVRFFQKISGFGWVWVFTAPVWVGFRFLFFEKPGFRLGFGFFQNFNKFTGISRKILIKKNVKNGKNLSIHRIFCKKA